MRSTATITVSTLHPAPRRRSLPSRLPGVQHIGEGKDFGPMIAKALVCEGFNDENAPELEPGHPGHFTTGFGHQAILAVAGQVIDAVKTGKLEHVFLIVSGRG